jgi:hypothetical protein
MAIQAENPPSRFKPPNLNAPLMVSISRNVSSAEKKMRLLWETSGNTLVAINIC